MFLESGSDLPEWAADLVGDHALTGKSSASSTEAAAVAKATDAEVPPRAGKGSGREPWATYARAHGVEVTDDMGRDEIVDACNDAGVITNTEG